MFRLRQGILSVEDPGGPQDSPHGGVPPQVSRLSAELQPAVQPEDPPADPHGPQAIRV